MGKERGAEQRGSGARVPVEQPDPAVASRPPRAGAKDRPGFDLGGKKKERPKPRDKP